MKSVINISLAASRDNYELQTSFLGERFHIQRFGTDGNLEQAADLMLKWNKTADAIGLGSIKFPYTIGIRVRYEKFTAELHELASRMRTPVTTGAALRTVVHEWSIRHLQFRFGNNYFNNARVLFLSGLANSTLARVLSEFTENLHFADPILEHGIPSLLTSYRDLERYASKVDPVLDWVPRRSFSNAVEPLRTFNDRILRQAIQKAGIVVVPYYGFYKYMENCSRKELEGKTVITSTAYDDRVAMLASRGVDVIIDATPKILERVVGVSVLEAMAIVALRKNLYQITDDDLLEILCEQRMEPRVIYPGGVPRRVNRFAFIALPQSQDFAGQRSGLSEGPAEDLPPAGVGGEDSPSMTAPASRVALKSRIERAVLSSSPSVYSKITGIRSPTGIEAEGWLILPGLSESELRSRSPEHIERQLLKALKMAKSLGAQVIGLSPLPRDMGSAGANLAKSADVPVTTGISYMASCALWAAADAARRMGLISLERGKILKARTMVVGATGDVGSICCRLLAKAFGEVCMVSRNIAKLLALQQSIQEESPEVRLEVSTRADKYLADMDLIVAASAGAARALDIAKVKPGCVIADVTRPMLFSAEQVAGRPDVLVVKSGEVLLPGQSIRMRSIGLPSNVVPAGLAETILLALEGRFEVFTLGTETRWEKVREIYRLGLKHGMQLSAISGVGGVISDEEILRVKELALAKRTGSLRPASTNKRGGSRAASVSRRKRREARQESDTGAGA